MSMIREIPPTAGWPINRKDIPPFKKDNNEDSLDNDFKNYLNAEYAKVVSSGTAALYLILEALKGLSPKKTVIIPSYICPLVPLAVKRAGLRVEVCDITGEDFNFNITQLEELCARNGDILAVIVAHIAGIPADFDAVESIAGKRGIFTIEDCAQSLGAMYKNRLVGMLGDFSFYSLGKGKGLTIYEGGVVVTSKKEYAAILKDKIGRTLKNSFLTEALMLLKLFGYAIFYRPRLFWFVFKLPQNFWSMLGDSAKAFLDYYEIDFPVHKVSSIRKRIGHASFYRLREETEKQRHKAEYYIRELESVGGLELIKEASYAKAAYPYVTLIFKDAEKRQKVFSVLNNSGLGISQIYSLAITDFEYLNGVVPRKDCPGARYLAEREITLSTSVFLRDRDLTYIVDRIKKHLMADYGKDRGGSGRAGLKLYYPTGGII